MTTATPVTTGTQDVPLAEVNTLGLSEVVQILALVASLCTALLGHDFGITKNAQAIAQAAVIIIPIGMGIARSIKHHGIAHANAIVIAQQVARGVYDVSTAVGKHQAPTPTVTPPLTPAGDDVGADLPTEDLTGLTAADSALLG